jgi:ribosomal protein L37AE/L43A
MKVEDIERRQWGKKAMIKPLLTPEEKLDSLLKKLEKNIICPKCKNKMTSLRIFKSYNKILNGFKGWFSHKVGIDESQIPNDFDKVKKYSGCGCGMMVIFPIDEDGDLQEKVDNAYIPLIEGGVTDCLQCGERMEVIELMPPLSTWRCQKCKITVPGINT